MKVWIIERDHIPMSQQKLHDRGRCVSFYDNHQGRSSMKRYLNHLPENDGCYYDAVLYERIESKTLQNLESGS